MKRSHHVLVCYESWRNDGLNKRLRRALPATYLAPNGAAPAIGRKIGSAVLSVTGDLQVEQLLPAAQLLYFPFCLVTQ